MYIAELSIAPFVPTPLALVREILKLADLKRGEVLYDLGCGDGRFLIIAAREFGARAVGIDLRPSIIAEAKERLQEAEQLSGTDLDVKLFVGDLMEFDIGEADVVIVYLNHGGNRVVAPKLVGELRKGTRIVSPGFPFLKWKEYKAEFVIVEEVRRHVYYYRVGEINHYVGGVE